MRRLRLRKADYREGETQPVSASWNRQGSEEDQRHGLKEGRAIISMQRCCCVSFYHGGAEYSNTAIRQEEEDWFHKPTIYVCIGDIKGQSGYKIAREISLVLSATLSPHRRRPLPLY